MEYVKVKKEGRDDMEMFVRYALYDNVISSCGEWRERLFEGTYEGRYEVNCTSILTKLIQEAGRFCLHYASDLFICWKAFEKTLEEYANNEESAFFFGFREDGVDDAESITSTPLGRRPYYYRSIYAVVVQKDGTRIKLTLRHVDNLERS